jgi:hypothetical protein
VDGSIRLSWRFGEESVGTQDFNSPSDYSCPQVLTFTMRLVLAFYFNRSASAGRKGANTVAWSAASATKF